MRISIIIKTIIFAAVALPTMLLGQALRSNLQVADESFAKQNYYTASTYYLKVFEELKQPKRVAFPYGGSTAKRKNEEFDVYHYTIGRLARSFFLYHDYAQAETWYAKITALDEYRVIEDVIDYAVVLRSNEKFKNALVMFNRAKLMHKPNYISAKDGELIEDETTKGISTLIEREVKNCEFAMRSMEQQITEKPELMDSLNLNVERSSDYAVTILSERKFMFTTTRTINDNPSSKKFKHFRNSFMTYDLYNKNTQELDFGFGLDRHAAAPSITKNGGRLYFTSWSNETEKPVYEIFMALPLNDSIWDEPIKLNSIVNDPSSRNIQPSITPDGKGLYFASNRTEGLGGLDIYYVHLDENGQPYGRALNLGPTVNTTFDEESPSWNEDEQVLYFASKGWPGMGGLDIYYTQKNGLVWKKPVNLGYPINSSKDDAYLVTMPKTNVAFFSSDRGNTCCYQLYSVELSNFFIGGKVLDGVDNSYLADVKVTLYDSEKEREIAVTYTSEEGSYSIPVAKSKEYTAVYQRDNYLEQEQGINTNNISLGDTLQLMSVKLITQVTEEPIQLENIYYDFNEATLRPESRIVLDKLCEQLLLYPGLAVEIGSHTDNVGTDEYNFKLSQARSQSVVDYMVFNGIANENIAAKGYGETAQKVPNENPDGTDNPVNRQINRRTEFKVVEEETGEIYQ